VTADAPATTVEATGETVSEAKWKALRELERLQPLLDKAAVRFQVLEEGSRGLLGVGSSPARVVATAEGMVAPEEARVDESELAAQLRALLTHVTVAIGLRCRIDIEESDDTIEAVCSGGDLGLLIGRHGQTIDAVQTLAAAILRQDEHARKQVIVDAAGYRDRRRRTVESLALRSAEEALRSGEPVALEAMSSIERRLVHERLKDYGGVATASEGDEPNRYVVVRPGRTGEARPSS
jgi:spoIIIJ-associated protein